MPDTKERSAIRQQLETASKTVAARFYQMLSGHVMTPMASGPAAATILVRTKRSSGLFRLPAGHSESQDEPARTGPVLGAGYYRGGFEAGSPRQQRQHPLDPSPSGSQGKRGRGRYGQEGGRRPVSGCPRSGTMAVQPTSSFQQGHGVPPPLQPGSGR